MGNFVIVKGAALPMRERKAKEPSAAAAKKRSEFERGYAFGLDMIGRYDPSKIAQWIERRSHHRNAFDRGAVAAMKGEPIPWQATKHSEC